MITIRGGGVRGSIKVRAPTYDFGKPTVPNRPWPRGWGPSPYCTPLASLVMDYVKPQPQNYPLANHLGFRKYPQCNITAEKYISAPKPFSRVVLTWEHLQRSIFTFLNLGAALVVSIPPLETSEPADGCDCMAFQGIWILISTSRAS